MAILRSAGASALTFRSAMTMSPEVGVVEAGDHPQQGRLAAAGRADQHDELAVLDPQVDVDEHLALAVALVERVDMQSRHNGRPI